MTRGTGIGSLTSLRQRNIVLILSILRQYGEMTQIELAELSHLSTATVSSIVRELVRQDKVQTESVIRNGRHALSVSIAVTGAVALGASVGETSLTVVIGDDSRGVLCTKCMPLAVNHRCDTTMIRMFEMLSEMARSIGYAASDIKAATIALPTPIDNANHIAVTGIMPGWVSEKVIDFFTANVGIQPSIENDANMAALAHLHAMNGNTCEDCIYVHADSEIGGAIIINGNLYHGETGVAGEFGHIQVDPNGSICACGRRGCLNTVVGARALRALLRPTRGDVTLRDIISDAIAGDAVCLRLMDDVATTIAKTVEPVLSSFDPGLVILGGCMSRIGNSFLKAFEQTLTRRAFPMQSSPNIVLGAAGIDAVAIGAMYSAIDRMMMN